MRFEAQKVKDLVGELEADHPARLNDGRKRSMPSERGNFPVSTKLFELITRRV